MNYLGPRLRCTADLSDEQHKRFWQLVHHYMPRAGQVQPPPTESDWSHRLAWGLALAATIDPNHPDLAYLGELLSAAVKNENLTAHQQAEAEKIIGPMERTWRESRFLELTLGRPGGEA